MFTIYLVGILIFPFGYLLHKFFENQNYHYFTNHGLAEAKSHPIFGSLKDTIMGRVSLYDGFKNLCNQHELKDLPVFGFYLLRKPIVMIQHPQLIKRIFLKDFKSFTDRSVTSHEGDPLGFYNMALARGGLWKKIRHEFTPFFSSSKLKGMFGLLEITADDMVAKIVSESENNITKIDLKELFYLCTTDIIARCAFGVEAKSLENSENGFCTAARKSIEPTISRRIEQSCIFFLPSIAKLLKFKLFSDWTSTFLTQSLIKIMAEREESKIKKNDLIDTLIELKNENKFQPIDILYAQAAIFFTAGHETTSTTLTMALFEISKNRNVHQKLRDELKAKLKETNGKITYDLLSNYSELPYLSRVVMETLRKYPVVPYLERICTNVEGYPLEPFSRFKIPYGMTVDIPSYALAMDERYFPDPMRFDPERFAEPCNISPYVYFPFGTGPRSCVGERFGLMAVKLLIAKIMVNYRVEHLPTTPQEIVMVENYMGIQSKEKIYLNFKKDSLLESVKM